MSRPEENGSIHFVADQANLQGQQNAFQHDTTAAMASVLECMTLQRSTFHIPCFDGRSPPLKEFLQDVANGAVFINEQTEPGFIKAILSKLKGAARESVRDKQFLTTQELINHLTKRFATSKKYQWYLENIINIRQKQSETVSDYHDRLQGLISGAKHALDAKYQHRYRQVEGAAVRVQEEAESTIMMRPIIECALEAFMRGLPEEMSIFVDTRNPANLEEAFDHALRAEERQEYAEKSRSSSYRISRRDDPPRPPSPYSRQMDQPIQERSRRETERDHHPPKQHKNSVNYTLQFTPEQLATFYRSLMPTFGNAQPCMSSAQPSPSPQLTNYQLHTAQHQSMPYAPQAMQQFQQTNYPSITWSTERFKLTADSTLRRGTESNTPASSECSVRRNYGKVLRAGSTAEDSPVVELSGPEFRKSKIRFFIDPGSDSNIIKLCALKPGLTINPCKSIEIIGINKHPVITLGTIDLTILKSTFEFHVVEDDFPISSQGILGRHYIRKEKAQISFWHNALIIMSDPTNPIPFVDKESRAEKELLKPLIKPFKRVFRIHARTRSPIAIDVINPDLPQGYLPRIKTPEGVFIGEAVVNSKDGVCHAVAINTTEMDVDFELTPQELIPFDFCELPGEESSEIENENFPIPTISYAERVKRVKEALFVSHLTQEEKNLVFKWAEDYADIFHLNGEQLSCTHLIQHRIPTIDDKVIHKKQYRSPNEALEQIDEQLRKQLDSGIIRNSTSPYNAPLLIVPKKLDASGKRKWRVVIDYRALNEKVIGDAYPLPNITAIFDKLGSARFFTVFDLASGFHQVETHPDDRHKTAFSSRNGHFEYERMPMGIKNAPPTFQRLLNNVLGGMLDSEAFVYLDDIIIYSDTLEEHDKRARRLYNRLRDANLKLQPDKCEFMKKEVAYLGHIVGEEM
ncbi:uncharacterized protein LOC122498320 [Leptopilina heterotoma]|uniref:uncharacterized protein LOC122498320 n=1 Tax=Leptopilina heterotoma TaxID=63436 RepID=UPI001CA99A0A|nr:uncharacterized protein LOC122498320 [Leptopilina heterotoma]